MPQEIEKEINMEFAKSHRTKEEISDLQALVILKHNFFPVSFENKTTSMPIHSTWCTPVFKRFPTILVLQSCLKRNLSGLLS